MQKARRRILTSQERQQKETIWANERHYNSSNGTRNDNANVINDLDNGNKRDDYGNRNDDSHADRSIFDNLALSQ